MKAPEEILGLATGASSEAIDRAYRRLVLRYPPELYPDRFSEIHRAYRQLSSLEQRMADAGKDPKAALSWLFPMPRMTLKALAPTDPDRVDAMAPLIRALERRGLGELLRREYDRPSTSPS